MSTYTYAHARVYIRAHTRAGRARILCTRAIYPRRFVHSFAHIHKREAFVEPCKSSARCANTGKVRSRALHPSLCLRLFSLCISLHMALRLLPISERSYVTRRELFALARPNRRIFPSSSRTSRQTHGSLSLSLSLSSPFSLLSHSLSFSLLLSLQPNDKTYARLRHARSHVCSREYLRLSPSLPRLFSLSLSLPSRPVY